MAAKGKTGPPSDGDALMELEKKLHVVRDYVTAVASGRQTGLYLYGAGGMGKSYTVLNHLEDRETPYRLFNSRMTALGLFRAIQKAPEAVHVLEDMERLTQDRDAQGVLRSALWAQPGKDRMVTWTTGQGEQSVNFRGGIILIANRPLASLPELRALASRIIVHRLETSDTEIIAKMRELAARGYEIGGKTILEARECEEVVEHLIRESRDAGCPLDMRLLDTTFSIYAQWEARQTVCHWHDLVAIRVREGARHFRHEIDHLSAEERQARDRNIVRELIALTEDTKEQERQYHERTGKSRADFYRKKAQVQSGEFDEQDRGGLNAA
jgi:hypothetical protein